MARKPSQASLKKKCDVLFSQLVRARGACERCGRNDLPLQCAHIVSRRYAATRADLANAWALCVRDHFDVDGHPEKKVAFAYQTRGEAGYRALLAKAYDGVNHKVDWAEKLAELKAEAFVAGLS